MPETIIGLDPLGFPTRFALAPLVVCTRVSPGTNAPAVTDPAIQKLPGAMHRIAAAVELARAVEPHDASVAPHP
jgi:hypothetical protein